MRRMLGSLCLLLMITQAAAVDTCHGSFINPVTDVCWSCIFPISLGDMEVFDGDNPDTDNPSSPICACSGDGPLPRVGLTVGFWEPIRLVDVTRTPFCLVNLNGTSIDMGDTFGHGEVDKPDSSQGGSFYHVHWYMYPLMFWLNLFADGLCLDSKPFDIAYMTEIDPLWQNDEMNFILNPEAVLFGSLPAQMSCAADAIKVSSGHLPIDKLFWCAGAQGSMYPLSGHVQEHVGGVQASTLLAERMTFKLHREGLLWDSDGSSAHATCHAHYRPIMPKSRYRYQMTYPTPSASSPNDCKPFGHTTSIWGAGKEYPIEGEDFGYLIWRKRNCCAF